MLFGGHRLPVLRGWQPTDALRAVDAMVLIAKHAVSPFDRPLPPAPPHFAPAPQKKKRKPISPRWLCDSGWAPPKGRSPKIWWVYWYETPSWTAGVIAA